MSVEYQTISTEVLVIGSEGAGARAAIEASDRGCQVTVATKGRIGRGGATVTAAADMNVDGRSIREIFGWGGSPEDSPESYLRDMVVEGRYLNDQPLAELQVREAPFRLRELLAWGLKVYDIRQTPGHSFPRSVYTSGRDMARTLAGQVRLRPIRLLEEVMVTDLLARDGRVIGAVGLDIARGEPLVIAAGAVVLATGGAHGIYPFTTGPEGLTGDGQAMALRAGAELVNMEMVQFIPTAMVAPPMMRGSLFIFLLGPQNGLRGWLLNKYGERFMARWDPQRMEHSTRDLLSVGIANEIVEGRGSPSGGVYYSVAHLPVNLVRDFARWGAKPFIRADWTSHGLDYRAVVESMLAGEAVEVAPAAHFFMGGVRIDERCETTIPHLLAAGEVAGGVHGANRLSGNAFTQMQVQGRAAGQRAAELARGRELVDPDRRQVEGSIARMMEPLRRTDGATGYELMETLQEMARKHAGVVRNGSSLEEGLAKLGELRCELAERLACRARERQYNPGWVEALQARNASLVLEAILQCAMARRESRGAHFRQDYRETDGSWLKNTVVHSRDGGTSLELRTEPVRVTSFPLVRP